MQQLTKRGTSLVQLLDNLEVSLQTDIHQHTYSVRCDTNTIPQ
jgi:hypothetical protein